MHTRVVIQSRLSSSRLPGKALMSVAGMPLVELVARRASRTGFTVAVATSIESYDDLIAATLGRAGIPVVRGPLDDVLARFLMATADLTDTDRVVRLTGDNPVADADLVQELIDAMDSSGAEYGRVDIDVVPEGLGVEVFSAGLLRQAGREATSSYDREHVTPWIRRHTEELLFAPAQNPGHPATFRATVDCLHDFARVSRLFDTAADPVGVPWNEIMDRLVGHVHQLGPVAEEVPGAVPRMSTVLLSVDQVGMAEGGRDAEQVRATFARAVDAGISDVITSPADAQVVATGLLPGLRQRMGVILALPRLAEEADPQTYLRYIIEKTRADSGATVLRAALLRASELNSEHGSALQAVLRDYLESGMVRELGVLLDEPGQSVVHGFGLVVAPWALADELPHWSARASIVLGEVGESGLPAGADAVAWPVRSSGDVDAVLRRR